MQEDKLEIPAFLKRSSIEDLSEDDKVKFEKEREERKNVKSDSNESLLSKPLQQEEPKEKIKKTKPKGPSIRERMQESILVTRSQLDDLLTDVDQPNIYQFLQKNDVPANYMKDIIDWFTELTYEYDDPELVFHNRKEEKQKYLSAIDEMTNWMAFKKSQRKTKKPRAINADKMISKLKYAQGNEKYNVTSIDPKQIIKAQSLFVFNTKTKKIAVYNARNYDGLKVKGTTIKEFDPDISLQKTLRKPEKILPNILKTDGKVAMKNIWKDINTVETPANGRINADMILLKTSADLYRLKS